MFVSVLQCDEIENEIEISDDGTSCPASALILFGWNNKQYNWFNDFIKSNKPILIPESVNTTQELISYVKSIK